MDGPYVLVYWILTPSKWAEMAVQKPEEGRVCLFLTEQLTLEAAEGGDTSCPRHLAYALRRHSVLCPLSRTVPNGGGLIEHSGI